MRKSCFLFSVIFSLLFVSVLFPSCKWENSDVAPVTINLGGSGSARAISAEEKSASVFNVYFNGELVGTNVSGNFSDFYTVGQMLTVRVEAFVYGIRIASGESSLTVAAEQNIVNIILREDREEEPSNPDIPYQPGDDSDPGSGSHPPADNTIEVSGAAELMNVLANADSDSVIKLMANIDITNALTISKNITLDLNGYAITQTVSGQRIISLNADVTLTLNNTGGAESGKLTSTNGINVGSNGAIFLRANSTLIMNGGTITGNTSTGGGGAVYMNGGTFIMYDGTISVNKTSGSGAGGGAIFMTGTTPKFEMHGGTITDNSLDSNKASDGGGAIYAKVGSITIDGGDITNNDAGSGKTCGGVYLNGGVTLVMTGGTISDNTGSTSNNGKNGIYIKSDSGASAQVGNLLAITSGGYDTIIDGVVSN